MSVSLEYVEKVEKAVNEIRKLNSEFQSRDLAVLYVADKYGLKACTLDMVITSSKTRDDKWDDVNSIIDHHEELIKKTP